MAKRIKRALDAQTLAKDVSGKTYIVTGANSGVGLETTRQLIKQGGHVVMACRRVEAAEEVAQSFNGLKGSYEVIKCDLSDLQSIRDFVTSYKAKHTKLHGLMCNAGFVNMRNTAEYTKHGFETTLAASYFGHFLMTELLVDTLKATPGARMGILSSVVHAGNPKNRHQVHLDDLNWKNRKFSNFQAYGEAKVANNLYALELADRLKNDDVVTASIHPGWARSNFGSGGNFLMRSLMAITRPFTKGMSDSNEESAQTSLHVLLSDDAPNHSGAYFSQSSVLYRDKECKNGGWPMKSPNPHANDLETAKKLVNMTYEMVGLEVPK